MNALDGGFAMTGTTSIGDPYTDPPRARVHESKGKRQFQTCNPKVGQTGDNWGEGKRTFLRVSENDPYADPHKQDGGGRLAGKAKIRTEFGFKYASPMKARCVSWPRKDSSAVALTRLFCAFCIFSQLYHWGLLWVLL